MSLVKVNKEEGFAAGFYFGHRKNELNPRMKPYVFSTRNGISLIDLDQTIEKVQEACEVVSQMVADGKKILFVGTKNQAKKVVEEEAKRAEMLYVTNRWLGGTLTNYTTIKASIERMKKLESFKESPQWREIPKKEQSQCERALERSKKYLQGIQEMKTLPGALFIIDVKKEHIAVNEANKLGIPVIAVVDTNCDPLPITHVIPGNDDAIRSIQLFTQLIAEACLEGRRIYQEKLYAEGQEKDLFVEEEKKERQESRFEGDIDLQGLDAADLALQEKELQVGEEDTGSKTSSSEENNIE